MAPLRLLDLLREIAALAEVHQYAKPTFVREVFAIAHNVRMFQVGQKLPLLQRILCLSGRSFTDVHHLADQFGTVLLLNQDSFAERALSHLFDLLVAVLLQNGCNISVSYRHDPSGAQINSTCACVGDAP